MVQIIPRWEWRMFAKRIEVGIDLKAYERTRHVESSEIYLVSAGSRANPKIRDGKLDIKTLEGVNEQGLEQWKPEMKASFPLTSDQVTKVYAALALAKPDLGRSDYDLDAFMALIEKDGRAKDVHVDKIRDQYDVNGCTVEMSDVIFDGDGFKTVAAENANEELVFNTVGMLGFGGYENTSYVRIIKTIKGLS